ncbi:MAG: hypothetical protein OEY79_03465 [Anaplasmataceae bacterium]|nr:hypothetical protein [Anaplasmataceae bacterium]
MLLSSSLALIIASQSINEVTIDNFYICDETLKLINILYYFDIKIYHDNDNSLKVNGIGIGFPSISNQTLEFNIHPLIDFILLGMIISTDCDLCITSRYLTNIDQKELFDIVNKVGLFSIRSYKNNLIIRGHPDLLPLNYRIKSPYIGAMLLAMCRDIKGLVRVIINENPFLYYNYFKILNNYFINFQCKREKLLDIYSHKSNQLILNDKYTITVPNIYDILGYYFHIFISKKVECEQKNIPINLLPLFKLLSETIVDLQINENNNSFTIAINSYYDRFQKFSFSAIDYLDYIPYLLIILATCKGTIRIHNIDYAGIYFTDFNRYIQYLNSNNIKIFKDINCFTIIANDDIKYKYINNDFQSEEINYAINLFQNIQATV